MTTFKEFLAETRHVRADGILFSANTENLVNDARRHTDQFKRVISALGLQPWYQNEKIHVQAFKNIIHAGKLLMEVTIPMPNGDEPEDADMFITLALNLMKKEFGEPRKVQFKNNNRAYYKSQEEFVAAIGRRKKPTTFGDCIVIDIDTKV